MERYVLCLSQGFKLSDRSPLQWSRKRLRYPRQWIGHSQLSLGFPVAGEAYWVEETARPKSTLVWESEPKSGAGN